MNPSVESRKISLAQSSASNERRKGKDSDGSGRIAIHDHWYYDQAAKFNQTAWMFLKQYELEGEAALLEVQLELDGDISRAIFAYSLIRFRILRPLANAKRRVTEPT